MRMRWRRRGRTLYLRFVYQGIVAQTFPLSTFAINVVAGLLAGLVAGLFAANTISPDCRLLLATGFLGGFSTFSTMMNETVTLLRNGKIACFIGYALASIVVPVMAVACGYWLA